MLVASALGIGSRVHDLKSRRKGKLATRRDGERGVEKHKSNRAHLRPKLNGEHDQLEMGRIDRTREVHPARRGRPLDSRRPLDRRVGIRGRRTASYRIQRLVRIVGDWRIPRQGRRGNLLVLAWRKWCGHPQYVLFTLDVDGIRGWNLQRVRDRRIRCSNRPLELHRNRRDL